MLLSSSRTNHFESEDRDAPRLAFVKESHCRATASAEQRPRLRVVFVVALPSSSRRKAYSSREPGHASRCEGAGGEFDDEGARMWEAVGFPGDGASGFSCEPREAETCCAGEAPFE